MKFLKIFNKRYGIQSSAHTATMANVINLSEGNISDFDPSHSSARHQANAAISETGNKIKHDFITNTKEKLFCLHFDTKIIAEYAGGHTRNVYRMPVLVASPDVEREHLIGVVPMSDGCGFTQAIKGLLVDWNL